jgi:hypothetical protein
MHTRYLRGWRAACHVSPGNKDRNGKENHDPVQEVNGLEYSSILTERDDVEGVDHPADLPVSTNHWERQHAGLAHPLDGLNR